MANSGQFKKGHIRNLGSKRSELSKQKMSLSSYLKGKFGNKHPCWKDSKKHSFLKQVRETFKYRQWRSDVFQRDNYTCVSCGNSGCYIEADHIKRFIDIIEENKVTTLEAAEVCNELWNINNGRTLCVGCHRKTETWGRRVNNNK